MKRYDLTIIVGNEDLELSVSLERAELNEEALANLPNLVRTMAKQIDDLSGEAIEETSGGVVH